MYSGEFEVEYMAQFNILKMGYSSLSASASYLGSATTVILNFWPDWQSVEGRANQDSIVWLAKLVAHAVSLKYEQTI